MVFIFDKVKLGVGVYFSGANLDMGCMGHGRKKYSKFVTKIPIFTYSTLCTSTRLQITQNLVEDSFLYILYNFEVKRTLFGEAGKKFQDDDFYPKNPSSTFRVL
jgi:hypothetical protein